MNVHGVDVGKTVQGQFLQVRHVSYQVIVIPLRSTQIEFLETAGLKFDIPSGQLRVILETQYFQSCVSQGIETCQVVAVGPYVLQRGDAAQVKFGEFAIIAIKKRK